MILGTGVGAGIVVNGRALDGANGIAGGGATTRSRFRRVMTCPLPACYCGRAGCIETYLSGPAWRWIMPAAAVSWRGRRHRGGRRRGRPACEASLATLRAPPGAGPGGVINILDPDVIVLGAGCRTSSALPAVPSLWCPHVFSDHVATRLVRARHGIRRGAGGLVVARLTVLPWDGANGGVAFMGRKGAETPRPDGLRREANVRQPLPGPRFAGLTLRPPTRFRIPAMISDESSTMPVLRHPRCWGCITPNCWAPQPLPGGCHPAPPVSGVPPVDGVMENSLRQFILRRDEAYYAADCVELEDGSGALRCRGRGLRDDPAQLHRGSSPTPTSAASGGLRDRGEGCPRACCPLCRSAPARAGPARQAAPTRAPPR